MACNRVATGPAPKSRRAQSRKTDLQLSLAGFGSENTTTRPKEELPASAVHRLGSELSPKHMPVTEGMVPILLRAYTDPITGIRVPLSPPLVREFNCSGDLEEDSRLQSYP